MVGKRQKPSLARDTPDYRSRGSLVGGFDDRLIGVEDVRREKREVHALERIGLQIILIIPKNLTSPLDEDEMAPDSERRNCFAPELGELPGLEGSWVQRFPLGSRRRAPIPRSWRR
jgi:hypothetical protein